MLLDLRRPTFLTSFWSFRPSTLRTASPPSRALIPTCTTLLPNWLRHGLNERDCSSFGSLHFRILRLTDSGGRLLMHTIQEQTFSIGKNLVSPLTRRQDCGDYSAAVSIRSGHGRGTHDRVYRFLPLFPSRESACRFAAEQGAMWASAPASA